MGSGSHFSFHTFLTYIVRPIYLWSIYPHTHTHVEWRWKRRRKEERKDEPEAQRRKELSERQGPVVSLVVVEVTQLTLLAQVKFQTFEHCSKYGTGYMQVSVITLANVYLT